MKVFVRDLGVLVALLLSRQVQASVVADWSFPASGTATNPIAASFWIWASNTPALDGTIFSSLARHGGGTSLFNTFSGLNVLQFTYTGNHSADMNGQTMTLTLTAGTNFTFSGLSYYGSFTGASAATPLTELWTYSIGGGASGTLGTVTLTDGNLDPESLNTSISVTAGQTITFTALINGATGNSGILDFANLQLDSVETVPEPATITLALVGTAFGIRVAGRHCWQFLRRVG